MSVANIIVEADSRLHTAHCRVVRKFAKLAGETQTESADWSHANLTVGLWAVSVGRASDWRCVTRGSLGCPSVAVVVAVPTWSGGPFLSSSSTLGYSTQRK